jgi:hypothetical protein
VETTGRSDWNSREVGSEQPIDPPDSHCRRPGRPSGGDPRLAGRGREIEAAFRTDSIRGGIRSTLDIAPDAPVSRFVLRMQGGKKGLIVNSRNICQGKNRARANLKAHNGRLSRTRPVVHAVDCKKKQRKRGGHRRAGAKKAGAEQGKTGR